LQDQAGAGWKIFSVGHICEPGVDQLDPGVLRTRSIRRVLHLLFFSLFQHHEYSIAKKYDGQAQNDKQVPEGRKSETGFLNKVSEINQEMGNPDRKRPFPADQPGSWAVLDLALGVQVGDGHSVFPEKNFYKFSIPKNAGWSAI